MIDRKEAHRLLDKLLDAIELERAANSNECRAQAQADYLKARDALLRRVGGVDVERKRMEIEVLGLPAGSPVDPTDFEQFADRYVKGSPEDENRLRLVLARHAQDHSDLLTTRFAGVFSDTMLRNYEGRYGALDGPANRQGVEKRTAWPENVRDRIMQHAGYAAGVEFGDGHIPRDYWKRVAKAQHDELAKVRGFKRHEWRPATARDYSQTGATAGVFQLARSQGIAAGKAENPDLSKMELMLAVP